MGWALKSLLVALATVAWAPQAIAQSGVVSGPPQIKVEPVWIAVAGGFDGNGRNVGVGFFGTPKTRDDAEQGALLSCRKYGRGVRGNATQWSKARCLCIVPGTRG